MAGKASGKKRSKNAKVKGARRAARVRKRPSTKATGASGQLVNSGLHDLTNLATAVKAYLELLTSQSALDPKQKYYVDRAREQVEMMVDLVRELKEKIN